MALLEPLELNRRLRPGSVSLDIVPLIDVLLIGFILMLMGSRFIMAPGFTINVAEASSGLTATQKDVIAGLPTVDVLTVNSAETVLYNGQFFSITQLQVSLNNGMLSPNTDHALLIRLNAGLPADLLFYLSEWAEAAGYRDVQVAVKLAPTNEINPR